MEKETPKGQRFSQVYLKRDNKLKDSRRFRKRLGTFYAKVNINNLYKTLHEELGVEVPYHSLGGYSIGSFFEEADIRDVLDAITIIYKKQGHEAYANKWHQFVSRVFREEGLGYSLDEEGGVHYYIDEEFEINRHSTISALGDPKYGAVLSALEDGYGKLDASPPDAKNAIRMTFEAMEILYKIMVDSGAKDRLNVAGVKAKVVPLAKSIYGEDTTEGEVIKGLLDGFCDWINSCHMYRHGQKGEELKDPPIELAVGIISMGASYLRLLVHIDSQGK